MPSLCLIFNTVIRDKENQGIYIAIYVAYMCISYIHFIIKACIYPFSVFLKHMQINVSFKVALVTNYVSPVNAY